MENITKFLDFILIISVFLSLSYPKEISGIMNTIYGKFVSICIIVLYTHINKIYGLVICLLIVYCYQFIYIEELTEHYNNLVESFVELNHDNSNMHNTHDASNYNNSSSIYNVIEYENNKETLLLNTVTSVADDIHSPPIFETADSDTIKQKFLEEICINNHPYYNSFLVKTDMIRHVFPDVKFYKKECNICDKTCGFSLNKMDIQEDLQKPKHSGDYKENNFYDAVKNAAVNSYEYIDVLAEHLFHFL